MDKETYAAMSNRLQEQVGETSDSHVYVLMEVVAELSGEVMKLSREIDDLRAR